MYLWIFYKTFLMTIMKNLYISLILGTLLLIMLTECLVVVTLHLALQCMVAAVVEIQIFALLEHHQLYHDIYYFSTCFWPMRCFVMPVHHSPASSLSCPSYLTHMHIFFIYSKILNIVVYPTALFSIIFRICNTAIPSECI